MIDKFTAERIKEAADIVDVVGDYVHLVRRGANYMGLCPFHNERTPSFSVNKQKNFCYCFSCKKGGSPVNFLMQKEGISYHEALLQLARRYGIKVEERELTDDEKQRISEREGMYIANGWAMKKMESDMRDTEEGRDVGLQYFYQRGVTDEAIKTFRLGYALDNGHALTDAARRAGFDLSVLKACGLVGTSQQGRDYDRFRGRVIFPVMNSSGKVVAFGGRDLKGGMAKYINSPESVIYKKSNELYGIFQAKGAITKCDKCFLVEGYMDVIGMWQAGMQNVIASSGTALTDGQINLIHRFTKNVTLIYDGDAAGIKASLRGINLLLSHDLDVKMLLLPDGHDPDSFARQNSPEQFQEYVEQNETDIIRYVIKVKNDEVNDDPGRKAQAVRSVVESIACIPDQIKRVVYVQECARLMNLPEETVMAAVTQERYRITEEMRRQRDRNAIDRMEQVSRQQGLDAPPVPTEGDTASRAQTESPATRVPTTGSVRKPEVSPFYDLELSVVTYAVKYGYLIFYIETDDDDNVIGTYTVLDYIEKEISDDAMEFQTEVFRMIMDRLKEMHEDFLKDLERFTTDLEDELQKMRQKGYDEIAAGNLDMQAIALEESRLEERVEETRTRRVTEFTREYPSQKLISDENDAVRDTVTQMVSEPYRLSNIYLKQGTVETDEDRLGLLLPRAIIEWKSELMEQKVKRAMARLEALQKEALTDETMTDMMRLQREIAHLVGMRSAAAREIGDRVLSPRITRN